MPKPLPLVPTEFEDFQTYPFHHATEYASLQIPTEEERWLVPGIIPKHGTVLLASGPKKGKTLFAAALARALATGSEFLGHQLEKAPVLWCAYEETPSERMPSLRELQKEDPFFIGFPPNLSKLDDPFDGILYTRKNNITPKCEIYRRATEMKACLIVIDCLHASVQNTNLSDNLEARRLMATIRDLSHNAACATLVLHHLTKSAHRGYHPERFADSAQLLAAASTHFFLDSWQERPEDPFRIRLHGSGRTPVPPKVQDIISVNPNSYALDQPDMGDTKQTQEESPKPVQAELDLRRALMEESNLSAKELAEELGKTPDYVRKLVVKMPDVIRTWDRQERTHFYSLLDDLERLQNLHQQDGIKVLYEQSPGPKGEAWIRLPVNDISPTAPAELPEPHL